MAAHQMGSAFLTLTLMLSILWQGEVIAQSVLLLSTSPDGETVVSPGASDAAQASDAAGADDGAPPASDGGTDTRGYFPGGPGPVNPPLGQPGLGILPQPGVLQPGFGGVQTGILGQPGLGNVQFTGIPSPMCCILFCNCPTGSNVPTGIPAPINAAFESFPQKCRRLCGCTPPGLGGIATGGIQAGVVGGGIPQGYQQSAPVGGGCRYWCKTPPDRLNPQGRDYCCESGNQAADPLGAQIIKSGICPPIRLQCPQHIRNFGPPITCSGDGSCKDKYLHYNNEKCCFDECLEQHVCKPPLYPSNPFAG